MTRPNPLAALWHRFTTRTREASHRRRQNALRALSVVRRAGREESHAGGIVSATYLHNRVARWGIAVGTAALLTTLLCLHLWSNRVSLRLGDIAASDVVAQRTVRYEDTAATAQLRSAALSGVGRRYELIPDAAQNAAETARAVFDVAGRWANLPAGDAPSSTVPAGNEAAQAHVQSALEETRRLGAAAVTKDTVAYLFRLSPADRADIRAAASTLTERLMASPITDDSGLAIARRGVETDPDVVKFFPDPARRRVIARVIAASLVPNRRFDMRGTAREQQAAQIAVAPQLRRISAGEPVIRGGERVTQQHLDALDALGLQSTRLDSVSVALIAVMVVGMVGFVATYLRLFHRTLYYDTRLLVLLSILSILAVAGLKVGSLLLGLPFSGVHFGYLGMMCVASAGMAIALLIDAGVATLTVALLSIASGMILNNELRFTLLTLGSSLVGIVAAATLKHRSDYLRATLILCTANAALNALVGQLEGDLPGELLSGALWGAVSGLFAIALFYTGVAIFERWFGITTHLRLLELSDPATPVLQEFRLRVPGTYAHSLMVGTLSHAAAEAIGADSLLCRVAAYYHDLGKMNRPEFFIENQSGIENVHDRIAPSLSALVLIAHVKDGVEMGRAMGLPPRVIELIEQHHGRTLMQFFYHRATCGVPNPAMEAQFRYPGPKPQTKEAALLMLADSVEAASRSLDKPTPARIASFVADIIEEKRADGQLDECNLTLGELKTAQESFARTLSGALHARIAYPGDRKKNEKAEKREAGMPGLPEAADLPTPDLSYAPVPLPVSLPAALAEYAEVGKGERVGGDVPLVIRPRSRRRAQKRF